MAMDFSEHLPYQGVAVWAERVGIPKSRDGSASGSLCAWRRTWIYHSYNILKKHLPSGYVKTAIEHGHL